jgi:D-tyrosyl-tRNA(Tyr) deacylase
MRVLIQRVKEASVTVDNEVISLIHNGLLIFIGITEDDDREDILWLTKKIANIRLFDDENGVMNRSVIDAGGDILAVSQFTLMASTKKGNRPSYIKAAKPDISIPLYEEFCSEMEIAVNKPIQRGVFGADMKVRLLNDGPVTIFIDSKNKE